MKTRRFLTSFLVFLLLSPAAAQQAPLWEPVAREAFGDEHLSWMPVQAYRSISIVLANEGGLLVERRFKAGEAPHIDLLELSEESGGLPDGPYRYELRAAPIVPESVLERLRRSREEGNSRQVTAVLRGRGKLPARPLIQAGSFQLLNGRIAPTRIDRPARPEEIGGGGGSSLTNWELGESAGDLQARYLPPNPDRIPFQVDNAAPSFSLSVGPSGQLGLGTSLPGRELEIVSSDTPTIRLHQSAGAFPEQEWDLGLSLSGNETAFFIRDESQGTTPFTLAASSGNVGIGVTSASASLHVGRDDGTSQLLVEETSGLVQARELLVLKNNGNVKFSFSNTDNGDTWAFNAHPEGLRISLQDTGVREAVFETDGDLVIAGSLTTANSTVPDYVFEEGYELMSLSDLGEYVSREKHLPRIPSAKEIERAGSLDMTAMQMKLLEKIEELTLYTLAQEKKIERLQALLEQVIQGSVRDEK